MGMPFLAKYINVKTNTPKSKRQYNSAMPLAEPGEKTIYLRWRIILTILLLALLILMTMVASASQPIEAASAKAPVPRPASQKLTNRKVVSFYYTWFDEASWNSTLSDQPQQSYVSRDRGLMGRHIDQAKQAGIDAFIVAWYGPQVENNQTEPNLVALLEEAAARNFQIGILFETNSPFFGGIGDVTNALSHALSTHVHHPAYLRAANGQPVIFFWRSEDYSVDAWRGVRGQVDPNYGSVWVGDGINTAYLAVFDGHHLYSNTWNPPSDLTYTNQKFANWVAQGSNQFGTPKSWVATVMPGYNDVGIRPGSGFAQSREGGAYFDRSWQAAINSTPAWIVINSFNEWPEGSYIEPSVTYGDQFLQQSARWSQQFKTGAGNQVASAPATVASQPTIPQAEAVPVTKFDSGANAQVAVSLLNLRSGPGTDTQVVTMLSHGESLSVVSQQDRWLEVDVNGQRGWVFASMVEAGAKKVADLSSTDTIDTVATVPTVPTALNDTSSNVNASVGNETGNEAGSQANSIAGSSAGNPQGNNSQADSTNSSITTPGEASALPRFIPNHANPKYILQSGHTVSVDVALLNLRSGPGTNTEVLAALPYGSKLIVEDPSIENPEWIQVQSANISQNDQVLVGWVYVTMIK